jgi:hypothetical protein
VPRATARRTAYEWLEVKYDHLRSLYTRLKETGRAEAFALLERIRVEVEVPSIPEEVNICDGLSDTTDTSVKDGAIAHYSESTDKLTRHKPSPLAGEDSPLLSESRYGITAFSSATWPISIPPDTNMHSTAGVLHPSTRSPEGVRLSVCQWNSRGEIGYDTHISTSHKILLLPAVNHQFALGSAMTTADLRPLAWIGSAWLLRKNALGVEDLPCDDYMPFSKLLTKCVLFSDLSVQQVQNYSAAYFNTFNRLFPLLDRDLFMNMVLARLSRQSCKDDDSECVLALLVFALGQLAYEGVYAPSASAFHSEHSGFRGGTTNRPPGLGFFNQARQRFGLVATRSSLETVQILLLQGTFFEACARHADFWSSVSAASMSCMFLIKGQAVDWSSRYGDLVKRAFWICVLHERSVSLEFCVADTGIEALADLVPWPHFPDLPSEERTSGSAGAEGTDGLERRGDSDSAYHLTAMIALGRLIRRASDVIHEYEPVLHDVTWRANEPLACGNGVSGEKL